MLSNIVDDLASKVELEKSTNFSDGKALKFRIKVGIDNLSTRKNAEIYSGLGLDVSPSSSLEDSPMDSEGLLCHDLRDIPYESPTSILQVKFILHHHPILTFHFSIHVIIHILSLSLYIYCYRL